jgi:hypothetical protein
MFRELNEQPRMAAMFLQLFRKGWVPASLAHGVERPGEYRRIEDEASALYGWLKPIETDIAPREAWSEPCGCHACDDGVQAGHFACSQPSADMLRSERNGFVSRRFLDGKWRWVR